MKWFGQIGFEGESEQTSPFDYDPPKIIERNYYGDVLRHKIANDTSNIVTDFKITNQLSVLSDPYLYKNLTKIVYVTFLGSKWKVGNVDIQYPRIIIDIGETYKEESDEDT